MKRALIAFLYCCLGGLWFVEDGQAFAQNIPLVINSGQTQQLPGANSLVDANGRKFGLMVGSFTTGHCLVVGSAVNQINDAGAACGSGGGSVSSVGLTMPSIFTVSGSPVTGAGTLGVTSNTQSANLFYVGPTSGAAAIPTFRGFNVNDFNGGTNASTSTFWRGDLTWAQVPAPTLNFPGYTCANSGSTINCAQPCFGFPIVSCTINVTTQAPLLTMTTKPAVGDILVSATAVNTGAGPSPGANWTEVSICSDQAVAYHVVTPGDGSTFLPWSWGGGGQLATQVMADVTAMGAGGGSWSSVYNSTGCNTSGGGGSGNVTQSGSTPATGAIQLALGTYVDSNSGGMTVSLTGIATDVQYAVPAAGGTIGHNQAAGMGYNVGGNSGSAYSATWTWSGGGIGAHPLLSVMFFNAGSGASAPACAPNSGSCVMTGNAGPAALYMTLSGAGSAATLALSQFPGVANDYVCAPLVDKTTTSIWGLQTGFSKTGATFTFYTAGGTSAASPGATDVVMATCWGT